MTGKWHHPFVKTLNRRLDSRANYWLTCQISTLNKHISHNCVTLSISTERMISIYYHSIGDWNVTLDETLCQFITRKTQSKQRPVNIRNAARLREISSTILNYVIPSKTVIRYHWIIEKLGRRKINFSVVTTPYVVKVMAKLGSINMDQHSNERYIVLFWDYCTL